MTARLGHASSEPMMEAHIKDQRLNVVHFSRCFSMKRRKAQLEESAYDIVILYGSGLGVPSALAALSFPPIRPCKAN